MSQKSVFKEDDLVIEEEFKGNYQSQSQRHRSGSHPRGVLDNRKLRDLEKMEPPKRGENPDFANSNQ